MKFNLYFFVFSLFFTSLCAEFPERAHPSGTAKVIKLDSVPEAKYYLDKDDNVLGGYSKETGTFYLVQNGELSEMTFFDIGMIQTGRILPDGRHIVYSREIGSTTLIGGSLEGFGEFVLINQKGNDVLLESTTGGTSIILTLDSPLHPLNVLDPFLDTALNLVTDDGCLLLDCMDEKFK